MKSGIVMEVTQRYYVVMTPDGAFLKVKKMNEHDIGEEISFSVQEEESSVTSRLLSVLKMRRFALAFAVLLAFVPFLMNLQPGDAYAYVAIDINPSLELAVDQKQTVTDMKAYNEDGKTIIRQLRNWKGRKLAAVMEDIIDQSEKSGYLKNERDVMISVTHLAKKNKAVDGQIHKTIRKVEQTRHVTVSLIPMDKKTRDQAEEQGVSPNKWAVAQSKGVPIAKIKEKSVADINKMLEAPTIKKAEPKTETPSRKREEKQKQKKMKEQGPKTEKQQKIQNIQKPDQPQQQRQAKQREQQKNGKQNIVERKHERKRPDPQRKQERDRLQKERRYHRDEPRTGKREHPAHHIKKEREEQREKEQRGKQKEK